MTDTNDARPYLKAMMQWPNPLFVPDLDAAIRLGIHTLADRVSQTAHEHGWWDINDDGSRNMGEMIALMHSELSEALECWRNDEDELWYSYGAGIKHENHELPAERVTIGDSEPGEMILGKPEGIASEFADVIIRILDTCHTLEIPIVEALLRKAAYNDTRPYRHEGKRA